MTQNNSITFLRKILRFYTGFALSILLLQLSGLLIYFINVWPQVQNSLSTGTTLYVCLAVFLVLIRSCIWTRIYWTGAGVLSIFPQASKSINHTDRIVQLLETLTRLLIASCILGIFFVPVIFLSATLLPFTISGWWFGLLYLAILLFPQAFGIAALILAFFTHQYALLLRERSQMKKEIELTI